jgi:hypothetical protein
MQCSKSALDAAASYVLAVTACSPDVAGPTPTGRAATTVAGVASLFNVQIRALPPDPVVPPNPIYGWGHLQIRMSPLDPCVPPNPIVPAGMTLVAVCGKIFNDGGVRYVAGGLDLLPPVSEDVGPPELVASFDSQVPADPCRRYELGGSILIDDALAADIQTFPSKYAVSFDGLTPDDTPTQIGGRLDGSACGPIGERTETDQFYAQKVCDISIH